MAVSGTETPQLCPVLICARPDELTSRRRLVVTPRYTCASWLFGSTVVDSRRTLPSTSVEPNSHLAQVYLGVTTNRRLLVNSSGRAQIKTGQSCGVSVPLTAILYGSAGTVVQVVRRARVETRRVETGLMSAGQVEITSGIQEGDIVVARAGALLREGDPVRAVTASADAK